MYVETVWGVEGFVYRVAAVQCPGFETCNALDYVMLVGCRV